MIPPRVWGWYAVAVYDQAQRSGHQVHDRRAFEEAVALDGMRRLREQALAWLRDFDVDERRLAAALADGQAPRYVRRRS